MLITPADATSILHQHLDRLEKGTGLGIPFGIDRIDEQLIHAEDGQLITILARPSHGKSTIVNHYARQASLQYMANKGEYAPPMIVSLESPIEEIQIRNLAHYTATDSKVLRTGKNLNDWKALHAAADTMAVEFPMIYMGYSAYIKGRQPRITMETVLEEIERLQDKVGRRLRALCVDYIQLLTMSGYADRRTMISECIARLKDAGNQYHFPVFMACQANRDAEIQQKFPVPQPNHAKETGVIEEASDIILSCMRPCKYWKIGEVVPYSQESMIVSQYLYFLYISKQRDGSSNLGFWLEMDPRIGSLADLEIDLDN